MKAKGVNEDLSYLVYNIELIVVWFSFLWDMNAKPYDISEKKHTDSCLLTRLPCPCLNIPRIDSKKRSKKSVPEAGWSCACVVFGVPLSANFKDQHWLFSKVDTLVYCLF